MRNGLVFAILLLCAPSAWASDCMLLYLQHDTVIKLAACKDYSCLERVKHKLIVDDAATRIIYAIKYAEFKPGEKADRLILDAMPSDLTSLALALAMTDPAAGRPMEPASVLLDAYFAALPAAVLRHPEYLHAYLLLEYFSDGSLKPIFVEGARKIMKRNPSGYCDTYRSLPAEMRILVLPECDREKHP